MQWLTAFKRHRPDPGADAPARSVKQRVYGVLRVVLGMLGVMLLALMINVFGTHLAGGIDAWNNWRTTAAPWLLLWRVLLYACIAFGYYRTWDWMVARRGLSSVRNSALCLAVLAVLVESRNLAAWLGGH